MKAEPNSKTCKINQCDKPVRARGMCPMHYKRWASHGDPMTVLQAPAGDALYWIKENSSYSGEECLIWPFGKGNGGYGSIRFEGESKKPSSVMCLVAHGEKPDPASEAAHSCGNGKSGCVNPGHLRWASRKQNHQDRFFHGTLKTNLTVSDVASVKSMYQRGDRQAQISKKLGISRAAISSIVNEKTFSYLNKEGERT